MRRDASALGNTKKLVEKRGSTYASEFYENRCMFPSFSHDELTLKKIAQEERGSVKP